MTACGSGHCGTGRVIRRRSRTICPISPVSKTRCYCGSSGPRTEHRWPVGTRPRLLEGAPEERWESVSTPWTVCFRVCPKIRRCNSISWEIPTRRRTGRLYRHGLGAGMIGAACADRFRLYHRVCRRPCSSIKACRFAVAVSARTVAFAVAADSRDSDGPVMVGEPFDAWLTHARSEFAAVEQVLSEGMHLAGIGLTRLASHSIKAFLWRLLNPAEPFTATPYREDWFLRDQLLSHHPSVDGQGITCGAQSDCLVSDGATHGNPAWPVCA